MSRHQRTRRAACWKKSLPSASFLAWNPGGLFSMLVSSVTNFLLAKQGSLTEIRPTFLWTSSATAKQRAAVLGACIVDNWQDATVHVVDSFESPGQRVSWASKLGGHLIVTRDLQDGPWIQFPNCKFHLNSLITRHASVTFNSQFNCQWQLMTQSSLQKFEELRYHPAGKIMTQRNLLITAEFAQLHQGIVEILRYSMENGWKLFETCQSQRLHGKNPHLIKVQN